MKDLVDFPKEKEFVACKCVNTIIHKADGSAEHYN